MTILEPQADQVAHYLTLLYDTAPAEAQMVVAGLTPTTTARNHAC